MQLKVPQMKKRSTAAHDMAKNRTSQSRVEFYELKDELLEVQSQYDTVLTDVTKFPPAGSINQRYPSDVPPHVCRLLDFVDGAMENWRLLGSDPSEANDMVQVSSFPTKRG